jgi:Mn2+/Fe2+ NRAMP family transporter
MAYADQKMSGGKMVAIFIVVLIHAALGYAFVTGLAYQYVKKAQEKLNTFDVEEPPPPPPDEPPPPPGAPGTEARPTPLRRRLSPSEILERSVREGYLWCGATFLLPPIFALMVFPMSWLQNRPVNELRSFDLAAVFILATLIGSFLPLVFVRRIGATLTQAGLKEEGESQTKLAVILGVSGAILWLAMCGWYLSHRL